MPTTESTRGRPKRLPARLARYQRASDQAGAWRHLRVDPYLDRRYWEAERAAWNRWATGGSKW